VLSCRDGLVLGRRAGHVVTDPGRWEPAPAGGLSQPDPERQLLEELAEELGVPADRVARPRALALIEDPASGVFDILFRLTADLSAEALRTAHRQAGSDEYAEIAVIAPGQLPAFLAAHAGELLPLLRPALARAGLLAAVAP
jgi:hypothetical protein